MSLFFLLRQGPVYGYYWNGTPNSGAHLIVVTGINLLEGKIYTNNPWGYSGEQTYKEFLNGYLAMPDNYNMPLYTIIKIQ